MSGGVCRLHCDQRVITQYSWSEGLAGEGEAGQTHGPGKEGLYSKVRRASIVGMGRERLARLMDQVRRASIVGRGRERLARLIDRVGRA